MFDLVTLSLFMLIYVLAVHAQYGYDPFSTERKSMSEAVKVVMGVFIAIFCVIVIFYVTMFFYLRKHGRNFASLLRRRRGFGPSMYGPQGPVNFASMPQNTQQQGTYNPYAQPALDQQGPRMPEPAHTTGSLGQPPPYNALG